MINLAAFRNLRLPEGFVIVGLELTEELIVDALGREAVARTRISGREFHLLPHAG